MKCLVAISLIIGVAYGASMYDTVKGLVSGATSGYGSSDDYGEKCYPTYETKYRKQCEDYTEKVCYTTHTENCQDVGSQRCKAMKTSRHERKCHDVSELLCSLKESVQHEEIPAVFTVQKCHTVTERVCDTAYGTEMTERDDFKCIRVPNTYCAMKERTVYDKTCRKMINFDCQPQEYGSFSQESSGSDGYGSSDSDEYGSSGYASSDSSYGGFSPAPQYKCKRTPETKCYTTPRSVTSEYCEDRDEEVCEKLTERVPVPQEKQVCHDEKKKICELEQRSQPKQVKKYVYTKQCRPVPKTVCDNADQMSLVPSCVPSSRKECNYTPQERCENVPKQHCYQIPYQVKKMECTSGSQAGGYDSQDAGSSGY